MAEVGIECIGPGGAEEYCTQQDKPVRELSEEMDCIFRIECIQDLRIVEKVDQPGELQKAVIRSLLLILSLTIPVASAEGVLSVPLAAVFTELGERYVFVKKGETEWERRPVQIGLSDYFYAEVASGLKEGEVVALEQPPGEAGARQDKALAEKAGPGGGPKTALAGREGQGTGALGGSRGAGRTNGVSGAPATKPIRSGS